MHSKVQKVLIVAAHPDDEVLGCGGTIPRLAQEGHDIYIAILGEGITSRYDQRDQADQTRIESLHERSQQVAELLGAKNLFTYELPDNRFDTVPLLDVIKIVEELIERLQPEAIYTHHSGDLNIDHVIVHRAVLTATRPQAGQPVKAIYAFEVPSSTEWAFDQFSPFQPNVFVNISTTLETKIEAMALYESEARSFPHPRSPEALRAIAHRWGSVVGLEAAEAFELVRLVR
ncbi:MAG: PIG-L family deacetylase [Chloroflexi bacterium]|nr:MAG: PIG-L family deacetylase [Chloroflexota bacterium]RLC87724.1 MAG: PIG-L family deacetylase [Chloroflexota bacterium]